MIRIGTSGWSYDHWTGVLYPPGTPTSARLARYVEEFDTVELNASHYRWPRDASFASWRRRLPAGFRMSVKAPRGLTHAKKLYAPEVWVERIAASWHELYDRRAVLLVQLPPSLERDDARLDWFLGRLPWWVPVTVELRHPSWHDEEVFQLLERHGADFSVREVAERSGLTHRTVYRYFPNREDLLGAGAEHQGLSETPAAIGSISEWIDAIPEHFEQVEASGQPADEKLRGIVKILLRTWRNDPDLVTVMVREVGRSPHLASQVDVIGQGFAVIERVIARGQAEGVFRKELDARLASWIVYGGLEEILTGWVLGRLPDGDEEVARAERTLVDVVQGGLARASAVA